MTIAALINKTDNLELVRDVIAAILAVETASQMALAEAGAKDPELWRLRVYKDRIEPWGAYLSTPATGTVDAAPIVNVSFETEAFIESDGDYIERQSADAKFNLDVYGYGLAAAEVTGHTPADVKAAAERDRATRLVRNIIMAAEYYELGSDMIGTVSKRFIQSITALDLTDSERRPIQQVRAARIVLGVTFNELSPQIELVPCAGILSRVHTELDGEVVFSIQQWFGD